MECLTKISQENIKTTRPTQSAPKKLKLIKGAVKSDANYNFKKTFKAIDYEAIDRQLLNALYVREHYIPFKLKLKSKLLFSLYALCFLIWFISAFYEF